ncbi:MAG: efflux transporter outer membrane subunit [bacterium]|nr:efflux transporter outer membrane subunit [bacterium]
MNKLLYLTTCAVLIFQGCSLAPRYEQPGVPIPSSWPEGAAYQPARASADVAMASEIEWRDFIADDQLKALIELALKNNRDLRLAALNVQKARGMYGIQRAELFPTIDASAVGANRRMSAASYGGGGSIDVEQYSVDLGISSWEIDFFGRLRSLKDQALEEYLATEEAQRGARVSLVFEITNAYLALAADQQILQLAKTTYDAQKQTYELIRRRFEAGVSNELDLQRAQTQVDAARVDISQYTQMTAQDRNALQLLTGTTDPIPSDLLPGDLNGVAPLSDISAGLPSETLLARPDILAAEHRLKAAYASIGAARAAFFPRISLTTTFGSASGDLTKLFQSGTETWNYTPQLVLPIFDSRLRSAYQVTQAEKDIMLTQYESAIQNAFRETADALAVKGTIDERIQAQESMVNAFEKALGLSEERYQKGIDSYLGVLDSQRSLYAARQQLVNLQLIRFANQARLYAVLGGGA